jgi:hypothetical protein
MTKHRTLLVAGVAVVGAYGAYAVATGPLQIVRHGALAAAGSVAHAEPSPEDPAERRALFGELHLHTGNSFDAYSFMGTRTTPDEAYRFARGEPITYLGQTVRRPRPLDFTAVTDHSEFLGVLNQLDDPNSELSKSATGKQLRDNPLLGFLKIFQAGNSHQNVPGLNAQAAQASAWKQEVDAANNNYRPGQFTTFVAYEWTSMPQMKFNLHRNVIFKDTPPEAPFSSNDSTRPEDLWTYLEWLRGRGIEALAIPHNANASGGLMYDWNDSEGRPISEAYAQRRAFNEPLTEVFQNKGQSETAPELSPSDEFNNFEVMEELLPGGPSPVNGSYVRQALGRGLVVQSKVGANPYKFGFVGASDYHSGLSNSDENAYAGTGALSVDPNVNLPSREIAQKVLAPRPLDHGHPKTLQEAAESKGEEVLGSGGIYGSGGLTGVWAEKNTRESIYAALRRKETFATSGPTIRLRFFGGWNIGPRALSAPNWVSTAYKTDAPMGGDLPAKPAAASAPGFILQAAKDPTSGNLDRIQVIKVWLEGGDYREKVFDVAWSPERKLDPRTGKLPPVRNTVNLKTATYANTVGAPELTAVWSDPEFDPSKPAVYYARAIEIPTPRWNTILAAKRNLPLPTHLPATIQERAVSSPIWYTPPTLTAAKRAGPSRTAAKAAAAPRG